MSLSLYAMRRSDGSVVVCYRHWRFRNDRGQVCVLAAAVIWFGGSLMLWPVCDLQQASLVPMDEARPVFEAFEGRGRLEEVMDHMAQQLSPKRVVKR